MKAPTHKIHESRWIDSGPPVYTTHGEVVTRCGLHYKGEPGAISVTGRCPEGAPFAYTFDADLVDCPSCVAR